MVRTVRNLTAAAGLMLAGIAANAQYFTYSSVFLPSPVTSNMAGSQINVINGTGTSGVFTTGASIVLANLSTQSSAPSSSPATFNAPWTIDLTLAPSTSAGVALAPGITETFSGTLTGSLSQHTALISNAFNSPTNETYNFGVPGEFFVDLNSYVPPGSPSSNVQGAFGAIVNNPSTVGTNSTTPEPGSMALFFAAGVPGVLLAKRARRR